MLEISEQLLLERWTLALKKAGIVMIAVGVEIERDGKPKRHAVELMMPGVVGSLDELDKGLEQAIALVAEWIRQGDASGWK